jgi:hypothetical protein
MKRSGLFLLLIVITHCLCAQIQLGVKGGLNVSDVVINNSYDPDVEPVFQMKPGFHAGLFLIADGDEKFGFGAELLYSSKGVRAFNIINLHYVTIPILLRYHFHEKFVVEIGPEVGYLVSANSKYGNVNSTWDNKLDIGLDGGIHYKLGKIFCGVRFNAGFSSVIRNPSGAANGDRIRYQNRAAQLSISVPIKELGY